MVAATAAMAAISAAAAMAQVHEVAFETKWLFNGGKLVPITAKSKPGNTYVLGISTATVGAVSQSTPERKAPYAFPMVTDSNPVQVGTSPTALAGARMDTLAVDGNGWFSYRLQLGVGTLGVGVTTDNASAVARGGDPQFIDTPGMFSAELGLEKGSRLYSTDPGSDTGSSHFELGAPGLGSPLASLDLTTDTANNVVVTSLMFASDPHLKFYYPGTLTELSDPMAYVQSLLTSPSSGLTTQGGLLSDMPLFDYSYDLTNVPLSVDAAFTSAGMNSVSSRGGIPEPGSLTLLVSGVLPLLGVSIRRRRV